MGGVMLQKPCTRRGILGVSPNIASMPGLGTLAELPRPFVRASSEGIAWVGLYIPLGGACHQALWRPREAKVIRFR